MCGASDTLHIGRAALHWWEEPCLVGEQGSGAIFFAHCALGCVYCQNKSLAEGAGIDVTPERLAQIMLNLQNTHHAANINLVTASHYAPTIAPILRHLRAPTLQTLSEAVHSGPGPELSTFAEARRFKDPGHFEDRPHSVPDTFGTGPNLSRTVSGPAPICPGQNKDRPHFVPDKTRTGPEVSGTDLPPALEGALTIPVVWNTSGYEGEATLRLLDGLVDIYLVDFKYANPETAQRLSRARDYPEVALAAIQTMLDQVGEPLFDDEGLLKKGVIIRHLVLPGYEDESLVALKIINEQFGNRVLVSIMNQFTLVDDSLDYEAYGLKRAVSDEDYERILDYADELGIEDYFWQEGGAASESFVPAFDGTGV